MKKIYQLTNLIGPAKGFLRSLNNFYQNFFFKNPLVYAFRRVFGLLTASITSKVKNNYAYVAMIGILHKISGIKFSVEGMVWP